MNIKNLKLASLLFGMAFSAFADKNHDEQSEVQVVSYTNSVQFKGSIGQLSIPAFSGNVTNLINVLFSVKSDIVEQINTLCYTGPQTVTYAYRGKFFISNPIEKLTFENPEMTDSITLNASESGSVLFNWSIDSSVSYDYTDNLNTWISNQDIIIPIYVSGSLDSSGNNFQASAYPNVTTTVTVSYTYSCECSDPDKDGDCEEDEHNGKKNKKPRKHKKN